MQQQKPSHGLSFKQVTTQTDGTHGRAPAPAIVRIGNVVELTGPGTASCDACVMQEELVAGGYLKPPPDAELAAKAAAKAQKAQRRQAGKKGVAGGGAAAASVGFRVFTSPNGFKVGCALAFGRLGGAEGEAGGVCCAVRRPHDDALLGLVALPEHNSRPPP